LKPKEKKNLDGANQIKYIVLNVAGQRIFFHQEIYFWYFGYFENTFLNPMNIA
jgi:hypothetical protein